MKKILNVEWFNDIGIVTIDNGFEIKTYIKKVSGWDEGADIEDIVSNGLKLHPERLEKILNIHKNYRRNDMDMDALKEFAQKLTENCKDRRVPSELAAEAKEKDIVIVYGYSDDNMEFEGAIYDEFGCYDGGTCYLRADGTIIEDCGCVHCEEEKLKANTIEAIWCAKDSEWIWTYKTNIPHETFEMYDEDEKFCLGIVFYKKDLEAK